MIRISNIPRQYFFAPITVVVGAVVSLGAAFAQSSQPAEQSPKDPVQITSLNDGRFRFVKGSRRVSYDLKTSISGCTGQVFDLGSGRKFGGSVRARVLDQASKPGSWFVLMQVSTNTGCNVQGMCGAGATTDLIWLKFDANLKVIARASLMVADCATSAWVTELNGRPLPLYDDQEIKLGLRAGRLQLRSQDDDLAKKISNITSVNYDHAAPERGLVISSGSEPLKP